MSKTFQESPVRLQSIDQLPQAEKTFCKNQKIVINCSNCNRDFVQRLGYLIKWNNFVCKGKHFFNENGEAKLVYGEKSEKYKGLYKARLYNWKSKLSFLRSEKIKIVTEEADFESVFEHLEK